MIVPVPSLLGHGLGSPTSIGGWGAVGWAAVSGLCGAAGLIAFYAGFAAAPISVVAPVAALVSTVLPVGIAIAPVSGAVDAAANVCYVLATEPACSGSRSLSHRCTRA